MVQAGAWAAALVGTGRGSGGCSGGGSGGGDQRRQGQ